MKKLALLLTLFLPAAMIGQTSTNITNLYAGGVSFNPSASPKVGGTALWAHLVDDSSGTYAFTVFDALPSSVTPFSVTTNVGAGVAQKLFTIHKIPFYAPTSAGVSFTGTNAGWQWNGGVAASVKVKGNWRVLPTVRFLKSSVGGAGYQLLPSLLVGWGQ